MMKHGDSRNSPGYTVVVSPEDEDVNLDGSRRHVRPHGVGNEDSGGQPREWTSWQLDAGWANCKTWRTSGVSLVGVCARRPCGAPTVGGGCFYGRFWWGSRPIAAD